MPVLIDTEVAQAGIELAIKTGLVPFTKGMPGGGKSSIHRAVAEKFNLFYIDFRLAQADPSDLNGFPQVADGRGYYAPMDTIPLEGDPIPEGFDGWYINFDEINSAKDSVQAAAYKVILDKMVGNNRIHPRVAMGAAGNREDDGAVVEDLSSALASRMVIYHITPDAKVWLRVFAFPNSLDSRVTSFIEWRPDRLNTFNPDTMDLDGSYACERTWEFTSKLLKNIDDFDAPHVLPTLAGTIGEGVAREFIGFCKVHLSLPSMAKLIANPMSIEVPTDPGTIYALTGAIAANADDTTIEPLMKFVDRMPLDFQIVCLRQLSMRDRALSRHPAVNEWKRQNKTELF